MPHCTKQKVAGAAGQGILMQSWLHTPPPASPHPDSLLGLGLVMLSEVVPTTPMRKHATVALQKIVRERHSRGTEARGKELVCFLAAS